MPIKFRFQFPWEGPPISISRNGEEGKKLVVYLNDGTDEIFNIGYLYCGDEQEFWKEFEDAFWYHVDYEERQEILREESLSSWREFLRRDAEAKSFQFWPGGLAELDRKIEVQNGRGQKVFMESSFNLTLDQVLRSF